MADKVKGFIISEGMGLSRQLAEEIHPIVDVVKMIRDFHAAYSTVREIQPGAVFVDLTERTAQGLEFVQRLSRHLPDCAIFILAREKDPDLILQGLRAGVADYLVYPGTNGDALHAVKRALGNVAGQNGEVIALFSLKGGQGVTSLSLNLADHLTHATGEKVLLADLNLYRGDVGICLNMPSTYTGFDLVKDLERMDHKLFFSSLAHHPNGFYVLPAPEEISDADQVSGEDVRHMLALVQRHMDYTVVDLPHDLSDRSLAVLDTADTILIIAQQTLPVIKSVQRTLDLFQDLSYGDGKVRIVLNRQVRKSEFTTGDLANIFKQPVFATVANDYQSLMQAVNKGKTLRIAREKSGINRDIRRLASLLTGMSAPVRSDGESRGMLGSLFSRKG
jgi:pilus assembly protein CpaE